MSKLEIQLLGALSFAGEIGEELALTRKNKLLLAALALAGPAGLSRERLAALFWRDSGEKQAHASLRQALAACRKGLGPYQDCLLTGPDIVALNRAKIEFDVEIFEAETDPERALALYRGDLLDGIRLREEGFEAWLLPMRERLRTRAVMLLSESLEAAGEAERSVILAARLLELEPTNEAAHQSLMRTYAAQGRDNAAIKQFELCRDLLRRDLAVEPSRQTTALFEEIKNKRHHPITVSKPSDAPRPSSRKPTVMIMPFENLSEDPGQAHVASGITQDIIVALLRHRWLSVINATNMVRPGRYAINNGGEIIEGNVEYLITGSLRKMGERLRINVQMVAAHSGEHIWSDSYDGELGDIFQVLDEITLTIASHIDIEVGIAERRRVLRQSRPDKSAWDSYHLGMTHFLKSTPDDHLEAIRLFARSMEIDPEFGEGLAWWSYASVYAIFYFDAEPTDELFARAFETATRAVEIDNQNADFHMRVARVHLAQGDSAKLMKEVETALALNPNQAGIYCGMGDAMNINGRYDEAIAYFHKALQLGPRHPNRWAFLGYGAMAHLFAGDFETAVDWSEQAMSFPHCKYWAYAHRAAALGHLGRVDAALAATAELLQKQPAFSRSLAEKKFYFLRQPGQVELYLEGLAKAGVPA